MLELWQAFVQFLSALWGVLSYAVLTWWLLIAWVAWWLWGVNWKKAWPVLATGAWVPAVLLVITTALVWSRLDPVDCACLGFTVVPNFWWQLGGVSLLAALTLFCGWLQGVFGWEPAEVQLEPSPAHGHGHGHAHVEHGHAHAHEPQALPTPALGPSGEGNHGPEHHH